ncbi:hypothetical protein GCM10010218_40690 [Streptomyces mashuensis]|uniref:Immediate-early protein 2 n=1 Tax=Streptomyces mashuensis TaxID=33904 RepID=A0A919ED73_9ACTN|nr:SRPBCC family protein [Streptomyces mashuensis]GHF55152.1 hypothetical protein GCM10010218_40690 [Streptomyces mashuensis]
MVHFSVERRSPLPLDTAWHRITCWERHAAHVPLTAITVTTPPPTGAGTRFVARTGRGPVAFDDPMEVVRWEPPAPGRSGCCLLEKRGRVVRGWARIEVGPDGAGSRVVWEGDLRVRGVPGLFGPVVARSARLLYGRVAAGLLREAPPSAGPAPPR